MLRVNSSSLRRMGYDWARSQVLRTPGALKSTASELRNTGTVRGSTTCEKTAALTLKQK